MLKIRVYGVPAPQGSKKGFVVNGRVNMVEQSHKKLKPWREEVSDQAAKVIDGRDPLDGHLFADITFLVKRPPSAKNRPFPNVYPDLDKLTRGVYDALKMGGAIKDDARIVEGHGRKVYADSAEDQGCLILLMSMSEWLDGHPE